MPESISLSKLQGVSEPVQEAPVAPAPTNEDNIQEMSIADIAPVVVKPDIQGIAMDEVMGALDAAMVRKTEQLNEDSKRVEEALKEIELMNDEVATKKQVAISSLDDVPDSNPFSFIDQDELDEELDDIEDEEEVVDKAEETKKIEELKSEIVTLLKPTQSKVDFTKFTINKTPISASKILTLGETTKHVADWMLYSAKKSVSLSELNGQEIEKFNPAAINRNRINAYKTIYSILYMHLVDDNKPPTLEAWVKMLNFFDIKHLNFAAYKACFEGTNFIPYSCTNPRCKKIFMRDMPIGNMIKYKTPEIEAAVKLLVAKDTTSSSTYETTLIQLSANYAITLRPPTVYSVVFENSILDEKFTEKYNDILGIISYIDEIYYIDTATMQLSPINTNPDSTSLGKTVRRKIKVYSEILKTLNSDEYSNLLVEMRKINQMGTDDIEYILPATKCDCGTEIPEVAKDPIDLLFTRHQLVALANM